MSATNPIELGIFNTDFSNLLESFPVITTVAPFSDIIFAVANPIPLLPPVISAIFPDNFNNFYRKFSNL